MAAGERGHNGVERPSLDCQLIPDVIRGRCTYHLHERLGGGGSGTVFRASVHSPDEAAIAAIGREVAVKVFLHDHAHTFQRRLNREAAALLAIESNRVPRILDWGAGEDHGFIAMEYFPRGSLGAMMQAGERLPLEEAPALLECLLQALVRAHAAGILHLDIKPSNVLVRGAGDYVLGDFGISQAILAETRHVAPGMGTPGYQAPEQRDCGSLFDGRTDLWGVGATLWSCLAGTELSRAVLGPPPDGASPGRGLPDVRDYRPGVPAPLAALLSRLVRVRKDQRPGGAAELLADLEALAGHLAAAPVPSLARPLEPEEAARVVARIREPIWRAAAHQGNFGRRLVCLPAGAWLFRQGEHSYDVYILLEGAVDLRREGLQPTIHAQEGSFFGHVAALTGNARSAGAIATQDSILARFSAADFECFLCSFPCLSIRVAKRLAQELSAERGARAPVPLPVYPAG